MKRFAILAFGAVILATAILAVLGYLSLRQWRVSAEHLLREQERDMATMAAEKIEMTVLKDEQERLGALQLVLGTPELRSEQIDAWRSQTPLFERVWLFDRQGRALYPADSSGQDAGLLSAALAEIPPGFWDRGGRRHVAVGERVVLVAVLPVPGRAPLLAVLSRSDEALRRDVLPKTLGAMEGQSLLAVLDRTGQPVYASRPLGGARSVLSVGLGEALPAWRVALYEPDGISPRDAIRRQAMIFMAAFGLLLVVIVLGLAATYRVVRRESEMARLKSDFVANVSHDLKTPLSLIRMFGETLELDRVADEATRREYYGVITRESERLTRLIDNVLDFSRIEGGRQRYDIAPTAVEPIVHEVIETFRHPLVRQGFKVEVDVEPDLPEVPMDAEAVKQALANLVDNAIKYSGERRRLRVSARAGADRSVSIEVADDGVGIPAGETERIFEKFYRVGRSDTQGRRGSGVGLALVKHIAEAHGGWVSVESRLDVGSRFIVHLPASPR
ncbi:MAG TPA: HAMP domain-containing sensor histidine kinase [Candidatus Methylomirabilis sp.]|nr:HAMP domain-containing sensor histidine kinase [Candidatus Methylomirabilis sp.]